MLRSAKKISLIIPTLNERENIIFLLKILGEVLNDFNYEIIVVDDNSPDMTWKMVEDYSKGHGNITLIRRRLAEKDLSASIRAGFRVASGDILGVIDADLSHDIFKLPVMISAIEEGYELVVGSRSVNDIRISRWPAYRKFTSKIATFLTKHLLNIKLQDPMSGFFVLDKKLYNRVKDRLNCLGYKILAEIYILARPIRVKEVPFVFRARQYGYSKLNIKVVVNFFRMLFELRKIKRAAL